MGSTDEEVGAGVEGEFRRECFGDVSFSLFFICTAVGQVSWELTLLRGYLS
jgi:hypothetical protein